MTIRSLTRQFKRIVFKFYLKKYADLITVNSQFLKKNVIENYDLNPRKIHIIYNGIDTDNLEIKEINIRNTPFCLGTIGRIVEAKRIDRIINSYRIFKNKFAAEYQDTFLYIIGNGALLPKLKKMAKDLDIIDKIQFTGFVDDINQYRKKLDLFVISSGSNDTFPLTFLEAMYCKIPVVCFEDTGGVTEVIKHFQNGFIVKNEEELASFIVEFKKLDRNVVSKIVNNAHSQVEKYFTISEFARNYKQNYKLLLSDNSIIMKETTS